MSSLKGCCFLVFFVNALIPTAVNCMTLIDGLRVEGQLVKRSFSDESVHAYMTERTCSWNEVCKEEFQNQFRCKCPLYSYCRSPGKYYNAFCSMTDTGYIWSQPVWEWTN